jgi:hypothetical protein
MTFSRKQLYLFISFISLIKIGFLLAFNPAMEYYEDHDIAVNLMHTGEFYLDWDGVRNHTFQFPVYPFLISLLYSLFGIKTLAVSLFHILLNTLSAFMLAKIFSFFWRLFSLPPHFEQHKNVVIFGSVLLFCIHPGIAYYAIYKVHPFSLDLFMLLLPLFLTSYYFSGPNNWKLLLLFLCASLAVLTRATLLVSLLPFLTIIWRQRGLTRAVLAFSGLALTVSIVCAPWLFRNYQQDHILGFASLSGKELWKGSLQASEGSNYLVDGRDCYQILTKKEKDSLVQMTVAGQDAFYKDLYKKNLRTNPLRQVKLYFVKLKNFWLFRSLLGNEYGPRARYFLPFYVTGYLLILLLSLYGAYRIGRKSLFLFQIPVVLSLGQSLFYVETRHRMITEPLLIFIALLGCLFILCRERNQVKENP